MSTLHAPAPAGEAPAVKPATFAQALNTALADALATLEGFAIAEAPRPLALRVAQHGGALWLDLGDETGDVVRAVLARRGDTDEVDRFQLWPHRDATDAMFAATLRRRA